MILKLSIYKRQATLVFYFEYSLRIILYFIQSISIILSFICFDSKTLFFTNNLAFVSFVIKDAVIIKIAIITTTIVQFSNFSSSNL
jgi:hypothetical protein